MAEETTKKLVFNANVSSIVAFEQKTGKSIMRAFNADLSITTIVELVKCLSGANDEDINEYVKENGFNALVEEVVKALEDSGFLQEANTKKAK